MDQKYKKELSKKYSTQLIVFKNKDFEKNLIAMITDLVNHSEGIGDYFGIRYDTVMSQKEWTEFSQHPDRLSYKSKIKSLSNKNYPKVFDFIFEFLKDVYPYYKNLSSGEYKNNLKKLINSLIETSFNAKFEVDQLREADIYVGRSEKDRDAGKIEVLETAINRYKYAIIEYAKYSGKNPDVLTKKIMDLCGNDLRKLNEALSTCRIDKEFMQDLRKIHQILSRDQTLSFADIKLGWKVWMMFHEIGIDVDEYLNLLGLPKYSTVKRRLLDFLTNKDFVSEMLKHMEDDLPQTYKKYVKDKYVNMIDVRHENSERKKYPLKLRTEKEILQMIEECKNEVYGYFPLAKQTDSRNVLLNLTHPSSTDRAFQSSIKNSQSLPVNTIAMTPRSDHKEDYLPTLAHEVTHALHRKVLNLGEKYNVLAKGASDSIQSSVMEEFSTMVDDQFTSDKELPYTKKYNGSEFPTFWAGLVTRFQVPFSFVQLGIRNDFDKLWDSGFRGDLPESYIWELKYKFDKLVREWLCTGVNIIHEDFEAFKLFDPYNPRDGVVYIKRYMMKENKIKENNTKQSKTAELNVSEKSKTKNSKTLTMPEAFKKRFGKKWIESSDARILLHWLLLESGRNEKTEDYYKFILNKTADECLEELERIHLNREDIVN